MKTNKIHCELCVQMLCGGISVYGKENSYRTHKIFVKETLNDDDHHCHVKMAIKARYVAQVCSVPQAGS